MLLNARLDGDISDRFSAVDFRDMQENGQISRRDWVQQALAAYEGPLIRYAQRITGDLERARDAVQETFLRLCREDPAQLDGHLGQWLYTVCRNQALDSRRKEGRMAPLIENQAVDLASAASPPDALAEQHESEQQLLALLGQLPASQQEALRLRFHGGLSYRQISDITGLTVTHVGVLIHSGLKTLRRKLVPAAD